MGGSGEEGGSREGRGKERKGEGRERDRDGGVVVQREEGEKERENAVEYASGTLLKEEPGFPQHIYLI